MKKYVAIVCLVIMFFTQWSVGCFSCTYASGENLPMLSIVIDDFGGYERAGVDKILEIKDPITCAVIPFSENTENDIQCIKQSGHEIILHMPMEAHIKLPDSWYGELVIRNNDNQEKIVKKLDKAMSCMPEIKGANIHIGSGVSRNKRAMKAVYDYMKNKNMFFLDSRTIEGGVCEDVCKANKITYLGRDVFLEADKNRSYNAVIKNLENACKIAKEQGYAVAIGHVGKEGGENTAKAIIDMLPKIKEKGIKIVPLSEVYKKIDDTKKI